MREALKSTPALGFCTFCMDRITPSRMATHLKRCWCRVDDGYEIGMGGRKQPMAFLLKLSAEGYPEVWMMLEAHCDTHFSKVAEEILRLWFPGKHYTGSFSFEKRVKGRRAKEVVSLEGDPRLIDELKEKERFRFLVTDGKSNLEIELAVTGHLPTAIMHRPVDLVAFPLDRSRSSIAMSPVAGHVEKLARLFESRRVR